MEFLKGAGGQILIFTEDFQVDSCMEAPGTAVACRSGRLMGIDGWKIQANSRYVGDGHPTFNRNPYNGYINPYYWVDDHPLLYGNNGSLDTVPCHF